MPKAVPIPTRSRDLVRSREQGRCFRCRMPTKPGEWSHRRRRGVRDEATHCPANGLWSCRHCHAWLHAHPAEAREQGWIVAGHQDPHEVPVNIAGRWFSLDCDGGMYEIQYRNEERSCET